MQRIVWMLIAAAGFLLPVSSAFAENGGRQCARKEAAVERQLVIARQHNNHERVQGLETALRNIKLWCSEKNLKAKAEMDVWDKEQEVEERQRELDEARAKSKPDKVAKRERKLQEAVRELEEARAALRAQE